MGNVSLAANQSIADVSFDHESLSVVRFDCHWHSLFKMARA